MARLLRALAAPEWIQVQSPAPQLLTLAYDLGSGESDTLLWPSSVLVHAWGWGGGRWSNEMKFLIF